MQAVEFEAEIKDGVIHIPKNYIKLGNIHAKIIILTKEEQSSNTFDPRQYFNSAHQTKDEIDAWLADSREGWR